MKNSNFIDLCKEEFNIYLKSTVKQTVVEYVSQIDDEGLHSSTEDDGNARLMDRVKQIKIQEFLHLLAKILANIKTMLSRIKELIVFIVYVLNFAAGVKDESDDFQLDEKNNEIL